MANINNVVLVGRVGAEPEIRYFESGRVKADFRLAIQKPTKDKETDWFDIKVWGDQVSVVEQYLRKGDLVGILGRLEQEKWRTESGENRSKVVVNAVRIELMPNKRDEAQGQQQEQEHDPFA